MSRLRTTAFTSSSMPHGSSLRRWHGSCTNVTGMRRVKAVLLGLGILVIALSVYRIGPAPILEALARLTWWQLVLVCLPYAALMAVDTLGWRFAFPREAAPFRRLYGARLAGEALNLVT